MSDSRSAWDAAAATWEVPQGEPSPITDRMVELAAAAPGERILELACGTGESGIATALAAGGSVDLTLSDFAPEMVSAAAAAAAAAGLTKVEAREIDLESIGEPDLSYDLVLCRMGIMLVQSPGTVAREICRVLRPDGRVVVAVWGPRERNAWLRVVFEVLGELWDMELPPVDGPSPFGLDSPERLRGALEEGGMEVESIEEVVALMAVADVEDWWGRVVTRGPLGQLVGNLPTQQRETVQGRAADRIDAELSAGALERTALVAVAHPPVAR